MIKRRRFVKLCASFAAAVSASPRLLAQDGGTLQHFERVKLVNTRGRVISPNDLDVGTNYVFHYPYVCTPCFLLNVGQPVRGGATLETKSGHRYRWRGGVGPQHSIVAFSAICAHKMTHPSPTVSFINYRHQPTRFMDSDERTAQQAKIIYCCSEKSVYDVTGGGRVLGGPAPQPLAAVLLDYEPSEGALYAKGTYGGDMFEEFFDKFTERLQLEYLVTDVSRRIAGTSAVEPLADFSENQVLC
ncbi:MAG: hypothetical protein GWN84_22360 [Gammaproteobacteria bacterium]|nr:hypothetical protein [Gammaproteobacteria bacterium]NIR85378.1 hypothetical protein [Gammaproteobacteria bacterium]NIR88896.1 hypothetical protein [Gammaproteobacteria bacterium]NIU06504.1 hypothetical protein [Gammaproteobacteria bacterium]NIV53397.1 hypothetical protein [Gammaproteobacteria bacterium]